ncbi:hypothetical protein [Polaribacter septentrionalilitoris]|uniref:hypothetical protein n=1 Tax=Polaribacter septentrionalilitoris TaxID=2494657 RepID=UPI00135A9524|nr:hypothetical protein [Polaribacter septentrionalilitoris]
MNKKEEKLLIEKVKLFTPFSKLENVRFTEQPDLIANLNSKKIGIEITECFQDDSLKGSDLKKFRSFKRKIGRLLTNNITYKIPYHLFIDIDKNLNIKSNEHELLLQKTKRFLDNNINEVQNNKVFDFGEQEINIKGIININLFFTNDLPNNFFGESDYGIIPKFTNQQLNFILNKKDKKLKKYQNCDEYWLLIREGDMTAASFSKIKIDYFETNFTKVFMYRIFKNELIELKN